MWGDALGLHLKHQYFHFKSRLYKFIGDTWRLLRVGAVLALLRNKKSPVNTGLFRITLLCVYLLDVDVNT
ncbi:hypothetical protein TW85_09760 [Marinomonas sp. S3726]|nr:hypothetical protein TW85_09760 [Marinomonas sp. S3726]